MNKYIYRRLNNIKNLAFLKYELGFLSTEKRFNFQIKCDFFDQKTNLMNIKALIYKNTVNYFIFAQLLEKSKLKTVIVWLQDNKVLKQCLFIIATYYLHTILI